MPRKSNLNIPAWTDTVVVVRDVQFELLFSARRSSSLVLSRCCCTEVPENKLVVIVGMIPLRGVTLLWYAERALDCVTYICLLQRKDEKPGGRRDFVIARGSVYGFEAGVLYTALAPLWLQSRWGQNTSNWSQLYGIMQSSHIGADLSSSPFGSPGRSLCNAKCIMNARPSHLRRGIPELVLNCESLNGSGNHSNLSAERSHNAIICPFQGENNVNSETTTVSVVYLKTTY